MDSEALQQQAEAISCQMQLVSLQTIRLLTEMAHDR